MTIKTVFHHVLSTVAMLMTSTMPALAADSSDSLVKISNPPGLYDPVPHGYSHLATAKASGRMIFIAGQGGFNNETQTMPDSFQLQTRQAYQNLLIALRSANADVADISKLTVLVVNHDPQKLKELGEETKRIFNNKAPAMTLIPVPKLALEGMLVEIDGVAVAP
jgi:enamine deaminase RidA (YjgF/YER057c/UK114 family)